MPDTLTEIRERDARWDGRGYQIRTKRDRRALLAHIDALMDFDRLSEIVSDSLAATTMGTDWAEAPEPSDEPGSPYVRRLTNEIRARMRGPHDA